MEGGITPILQPVLPLNVTSHSLSGRQMQPTCRLLQTWHQWQEPLSPAQQSTRALQHLPCNPPFTGDLQLPQSHPAPLLLGASSGN